MRPTRVIQVLQRRHGQSLGLHFFIFYLSIFEELPVFISSGTRFHIFSPIRFTINSVLLSYQWFVYMIKLLKLEVLFSTKLKTSNIVIAVAPTLT